MTKPEKNIFFILFIFFKANTTARQEKLTHIALRLIKVKGTKTAPPLNYICN
jgi:hypothetical protein